MPALPHPSDLPAPTAPTAPRVQVVLFDGFDPLDVIAPYEVLHAGGQAAGGALSVELVSAEGPREVVSGIAGITLRATSTLDPRADVIVMPGAAGPVEDPDEAGLDTIPVLLARTLDTPLPPERARGAGRRRRGARRGAAGPGVTYAGIGVAVPVLGLATAASLGVLTDPRVLGATVLVIAAAAVLVARVLPLRRSMLEALQTPPLGGGRARRQEAGRGHRRLQPAVGGGSGADGLAPRQHHGGVR